MIEKNIFVQAIESIEQQYAKDIINSKLVQEAFNAHHDFLYDTSLLQKQIIILLRIWFPKDEDGFCSIEHFCYFENFGKLTDKSIEEFYNELTKIKK